MTMTTKTKAASAAAPTWGTRVHMALTGGEDYTPIWPVNVLADMLRELNKSDVVSAIAGTTEDFDEVSYSEVLGWVERMQRELAALAKEPDDSVSKSRLDAALDALEALVDVAPDNWSDDEDPEQETAWASAATVLASEGRTCASATLAGALRREAAR